jgi:hypothetical protein
MQKFECDIDLKENALFRRKQEKIAEICHYNINPSIHSRQHKSYL